MMKLQGFLIMVCLLIIGCVTGSLASPLPTGNVKPGNDTINVAKLKALTVKEATLKKMIQEQDKKRNATYNGVSAETIEMLNDRQDSICLDLRSQLVGVQLQIGELKKANLLQTLSNRKKKETK